jgi:hypothetical protein
MAAPDARERAQLMAEWLIEAKLEFQEGLVPGYVLCKQQRDTASTELWIVLGTVWQPTPGGDIFATKRIHSRFPQNISQPQQI